MNNPARNAMIICGDGMRPERDDPKTYQQNLPQPTASSRLRPSPSPIHHLCLFLSIFRLSLFPLFAVFPPYSLTISPPPVPIHSLPFSPTLPSLSSFSLSFQCPIPLPFIPLPTPFHSPSGILSFPFPHPFISLTTSSHSHSRFAPLQTTSNDLQIRSSRLRLRTAHEGVNTNLTCSEPGKTRPRHGSGIAPDGDGPRNGRKG